MSRWRSSGLPPCSLTAWDIEGDTGMRPGRRYDLASLLIAMSFLSGAGCTTNRGHIQFLHFLEPVNMATIDVKLSRQLGEDGISA